MIDVKRCNVCVKYVSYEKGSGTTRRNDGRETWFRLLEWDKGQTPAERLAERKDLSDQELRQGQAQVLRPGGVSLSLRAGAARGAPPFLYRAGYRSKKAPDAGL